MRATSFAILGMYLVSPWISATEPTARATPDAPAAVAKMPRPRFGVQVCNPADGSHDKGVEVRWVQPGNVAAKAGIKTGDRILKFANKDVVTAEQVAQAVHDVDVAARVPIVINRAGTESTVTAQF